MNSLPIESGAVPNQGREDSVIAKNKGIARLNGLEKNAFEPADRVFDVTLFEMYVVVGN